jgi:hypothetical protein
MPQNPKSTPKSTTADQFKRVGKYLISSVAPAIGGAAGQTVKTLAKKKTTTKRVTTK